MWCSSIQVITPIWARPSAPPPCRARPSVGRFLAGGVCWARLGSEQRTSRLASNTALQRYATDILKKALIIKSSKLAQLRQMKRSSRRHGLVSIVVGLSEAGSGAPVCALRHGSTECKQTTGITPNLPAFECCEIRQSRVFAHGARRVQTPIDRTIRPKSVLWTG